MHTLVSPRCWIDWVMLEYHACPTLYDHVMLTCPMMFSSILREHLRCAGGDAHVTPRIPQESLMRGYGGEVFSTLRCCACEVVRPGGRLVLGTVVYHDPWTLFSPFHDRCDVGNPWRRR